MKEIEKSIEDKVAGRAYKKLNQMCQIKDSAPILQSIIEGETSLVEPLEV